MSKLDKLKEYGHLKHRDKRIIRNTTKFQTIDAKRKSFQSKVDFWNDQDSVSGPSIVENKMRNVLYTTRGSFSNFPNFGVRVDDLMYEQLDWANIEFFRSVLLNNLSTSLPNLTFLNVEVKVDPKEQNTLDITIEYAVEDPNYFNKSGPKTVGYREAYFTLDYKGFRGSN